MHQQLILSKTNNKVIAIEYFKHEGYHNVNCISKKLGYRNNRYSRRRRCIPEFLLVKRVRLVGEVWTNTMVQQAQRFHLLLRWTAPQRFGSPSTIRILRGGIRSLSTTIRGTTHNGIGGSRTASSDHTRVQPPQRRLGSKDQRVTSSQTFNFHESSWRAHRCTKCKRQEHKCSNPSLSNSNKATNSYGGIREEEQRGDAPRTPRSRSTRFPSLRGEMDWWKCRSRSPLSNPSKICKNHGRNWEGASFPRSTMVGERGESRACSRKKKGRGIYTPSTILAVTAA